MRSAVRGQEGLCGGTPRASAHAPENTMPAFEEAVRLGADYVETDLRATRDGAIVCIHDARVDRTTTGTGLVSELTVDEVRRLDAGSWFSPSFRGVKIPCWRSSSTS